MADKYLITGATGFVGSNLARRLIQKKKEVHIIVRDKNLNWRLSDIASGINIHECDLLDANLSLVVKSIKPQYIFHLAAYGALGNEKERDRMVDVNLKGTISLLQEAQKYPFKLFINTGSSSEYGLKNNPMKESDIPEPINDYAVTKTAATLYCQKIAKVNSLPIITFRLFSAYGHYEEKTRLIPTIILNAIKRKSMKLSSPSFVRDFIFIEDIVSAYLTAAESKVPLEGIFNVGSGVQSSIQDIVNTVQSISKIKLDVLWDKKLTQDRQIEPTNWVANTDKIKKEINWQSQYNLEQGLIKTLAWFKQNKKLYEKN